MDTAFATEALDVLGVDDPKLEAEFLLHLGLPFDLQAGGANDEHGPGAMTDEQLLDDQSRLDRFTQRAVKPRPSGRGYKAHLNWNFCL